MSRRSASKPEAFLQPESRLWHSNGQQRSKNNAKRYRFQEIFLSREHSVGVGLLHRRKLRRIMSRRGPYDPELTPQLKWQDRSRHPFRPPEEQIKQEATKRRRGLNIPSAP